jgi:flagellar FliJ protein
MTRFTFALDPVLRMRQRAERRLQRAVAELERERRGLEALLQRQQAHLAEGKHELRRGLRGTVDVTTLRWQAAASVQVSRQAQRLALALAGLHQRLESARMQLVAAARDRRAVELLREKRLEEWRAADRRRENAALDELAAQRRDESGIQP